MNNFRRKEIAKIIDRISELRADIESLQEGEQEAFDNMPESFQNGEKGEKSQAAADALENAASSLDEVTDYLNESIEN